MRLFYVAEDYVLDMVLILPGKSILLSVWRDTLKTPVFFVGNNIKTTDFNAWTEVKL